MRPFVLVLVVVLDSLRAEWGGFDFVDRYLGWIELFVPKEQ
jgi:hypothetical protein